MRGAFARAAGLVNSGIQRVRGAFSGRGNRRAASPARSGTSGSPIT